MKLFEFTRAPKLGAATAIGLALAATGAQADVTAADVWADWKGYLEGSGYEVTGQEDASSDALTVSDITMSMVVPEEDVTISVNMGEVTFSENGDGTVSVSVPSSLPMTVAVSTPDAEDVTVAMDYNSTDFAMDVSGTPDNVQYEYSAAELAVIVKDLIVEGQSVDLGTMEFVLANVAGTTTMKVGNLRMSEQNLTAGGLNYTVDVADPAGSGERFMMKGDLDTIALVANGALPLEMDANDLAASLENGFDVDATMTYANGATEFDFQEAGDSFQGTTSSESGEFRVALGDGGLTYDVSADNLKMNMAGAEIPLPIELAFGQAGINVTVPVAKGEDEQDFAMGLTLGQFTMSDLIWGIFDPAGQLPRDPATIDLDLTGKAKLFFDLFDPEQMEALEDGELGVPGELNTLDINTLTVSAAGAELTGEGAFTFDNSDLQTFDGLPAPDGSVDLKLTGANGLLDTLIAMGFVPEEQAMGVRMMMGLFAVPGDGEDTLTSKIEVKSDGQVLANGQRLR